MKNQTEIFESPAEFAVRIGVTSRRVAQLIEASTLIKTREGLPVCAGLLALLRDCRTKTQSDAKQRLLSAQAESAELALQKSKGEIVSLADVEAHMEKVFAALKNGVLSSNLLNDEKRDLILGLQKLIIQCAEDLK